MKFRFLLFFALYFNLFFAQQFHNTVGNIEVSTTGQLKFSLPIKTPPSVKNIDPHITLEYNSSNTSRGIAGYGFTLSGFSSISRVTKSIEKDGENKAIQLDNTDYYQFNGQRLLLKTGTGLYGANGAEYYTEHFSNIKIKSVGSITTLNYSGPEYFEVTYPDGTQALYGKDFNSRGPLEYNICKWIDVRGNYITYKYDPYIINDPNTYTQNNGDTDGKVSKITSIEWGGNEVLSKPHFNKISFEYNSYYYRSTVFIGGSLFRQNNHRLVNIVVSNNGNQFKKFKIDYADGNSVPVNNNDKDKYRITKITEYNSQNEAANPVTFDYEKSEISNISTNDFTNNDNDQIIGDFDGDGVLDFLKYFNAHQDCLQWQTQTSAQGVKSTVCTSSISKPLGVYYFNNFLGQSSKQYLTSDYTKFSSSDFKTAKAISFLLPNNQLSTKQGVLVGSYIGSTNYFTKRDHNLQIYSLENNQFKLHYNKILPKELYDESFFLNSDNEFVMAQDQAFTVLEEIKELDVNGDGISEAILVFRTEYSGYSTPRGDTSDPNGDVGAAYSYAYSKYKYILVNLLPSVLAANSFSILAFDENRNIFKESFIGNFSGDGKSEILTFDNQNIPQLIKINKIQNTNNFTTSQSIFKVINGYPVVNALQGIKSGIVLGDYNGDGKTDLFAPLEVNTQRWTIYFSTGKGFVAEGQTSPDTPVYNPGLRIIDGIARTGWLTSSATQDRYRNNVYAIDLDKDGKSEIVYSDYHAYRIVDVAGDYTDYKIKISRIIGGDAHYNVNFLPVYEYSFHEGAFYDYTELLADFRLNQLNSQIAIIGRDILSSKGVSKAFSFFNTPKRNRVNKITQAGLVTEIDYKELDPITTPNFYATIKKENYPYIELDRLPQSFVVSQLRQAGKKQDFVYNGLIANLNGRGVIGFRKVARTSWYADGFEQTKIWSGIEIDPLNYGVTIKEWSSKIEPFPGNLAFTNTSLLSLHQTNYLTQTLSTGVVVNLPKTTTSKDFIKDISTTTTINYNSYYSQKDTTVDINNGFATTISEYDYYNNPSGVGTSYCIGRPLYSKTTKTAYGDTKVIKEDYNYSNNLLQSVKKYDHLLNDYILEEYTYDNFGNRISTKVSNSVDTKVINSSVEYDTSGLYIKKAIDNLNLETEFTSYNQYGQVITQKDPFLNTVTNSYDNWGKLISSTDSLSGTTSYTYERNTNNDVVITETESNGNVNVSYTNVKGEHYLSTTLGFAQGSVIYQKNEFDALGRKIKSSEPYYENDAPKWNSTTYDDSTFPSTITTTTYQGKSKTISTQGKTVITKEDNGYGRLFKKTIDAAGNIISSEDSGGTIAYGFNALGQNKSSTYGTNVVTVDYDHWGRRKSFNDPSNGTYTYEYDGLGNLKKEISPVGSPNSYKEYIYNTLGQLEKQNEVSSDGTSTVKNITYTYNTKGQLISKSGTSNGKTYSQSFTYDATTGRVTEVKETSNNRTYSQKNIIYDSKNRIKSYDKELVSGGTTTTAVIENVYNTYDGTLYQIKNKTTGTILWQLNELKANGQIVKERLGAIAIQNSYAANDLLSSTIHGNVPATSNTQIQADVIGLNYSFDALKNELNSRSRLGNLAISESFVYDTNNRLTSWTNPVNGQTLSNTYDDKGRITVNDQVGAITFDASKIYQPIKITLTPIGKTNYEYVNINTSNVPQTISYNENNDPIFIDGQKGDVRFEYGLSEARQVVSYGGNFTTVTSGKFTKYYNENHDFEVTVNNTTGQEKHIIYIEGNPYESTIAFVKNYTDITAKYVFLHKDYLGSILAITDTSGNILENRHFDAWGNLTHLKIGTGAIITNSQLLANASLLIDRGYTGHEYYGDVNIIHMNGRLYDPLLRRFLNADENIQDPFNTQNYNKYAYVMNNPLMYSDPSGEESLPKDGAHDYTNYYGNAFASLAQNWNSLGIKDWLNGPASQGVKDVGNFLSNNFKSITNFVDRNIRSIGQDIGDLFGLNDYTPATSYAPSSINMQSTGAIIGSPVSNNNTYQILGFKICSDDIKDFYGGVFVQVKEQLISGMHMVSPVLGGYYDNLEKMTKVLTKNEDFQFISTKVLPNQKVGYNTALVASFISPAGPEVAAESTIFKVEQYSLRAAESGFYPVMKRGFRKAQELVWLEKGEVWKFGTTKWYNPFKRYTLKYLENLGEHGVEHFKEFEGTLKEALQLERMKIMNYLEQWGVLPPGNKMIK